MSDLKRRVNPFVYFLTEGRHKPNQGHSWNDKKDFPPIHTHSCLYRQMYSKTTFYILSRAILPKQFGINSQSWVCLRKRKISVLKIIKSLSLTIIILISTFTGAVKMRKAAVISTLKEYNYRPLKKVLFKIVIAITSLFHRRLT